jgi:anti-anti-sigma factor
MTQASPLSSPAARSSGPAPTRPDSLIDRSSVPAAATRPSPKAMTRDQITAVALRPGVRIVIADMTATRFCDSPAVRALVMRQKQAARHGTELRLLRPRAAVVRVLNLLGLDRILTICQNLEDAIMP